MMAAPKISTEAEDLVMEVTVKVVTGEGRELGEVERRIVLPRALHDSVLHRAEKAAVTAFEAHILYAVRLAIVRELERRDSSQFFRRLDTMHPDWRGGLESGDEQRDAFIEMAEYLAAEAQIAAFD